MSKAMVIALDEAKQVFAVEEEGTGFCAVFDYLSGPAISVGDIVAGDVRARTLCNFEHDAGTCVAYARTGPLSRLKAVLLVNGPPPGRVPWQPAQVRDHGARHL